ERTRWKGWQRSASRPLSHPSYTHDGPARTGPPDPPSRHALDRPAPAPSTLAARPPQPLRSGQHVAKRQSRRCFQVAFGRARSDLRPLRRQRHCLQRTRSDATAHLEAYFFRVFQGHLRRGRRDERVRGRQRDRSPRSQARRFEGEAALSRPGQGGYGEHGVQRGV
ncbi:hypothetical protein BJY59DRAFT_722632, partial [Rhodotorula toruloides]